MTQWSSRYLRLLGLEAAPLGLDWLNRFCVAHLSTVPFCNATSILRRYAAGNGPVPAIDPDSLLADWEQREAGGVCFEVAEMVFRLLKALGYDAHVVLGEIAFPGSHQAVVVRLREGPYLVDVGCGAPLAEPIPLIRDSEYHVAGLSYRFRPDLATMTAVQEHLIDGEWTPFCRYDLRPATDEDREAGYQRHHIPGETWLIAGLTLVRYLDGEVVAIREGRFTHHGAATRVSAELATGEDYERCLRENARWPELEVGRILEALRHIGVSQKE